MAHNQFNSKRNENNCGYYYRYYRFWLTNITINISLIKFQISLIKFLGDGNIKRHFTLSTFTSRLWNFNENSEWKDHIWLKSKYKHLWLSTMNHWQWFCFGHFWTPNYNIHLKTALGFTNKSPQFSLALTEITKWVIVSRYRILLKHPNQLVEFQSNLYIVITSIYIWMSERNNET